MIRASAIGAKSAKSFVKNAKNCYFCFCTSSALFVYTFYFCIHFLHFLNFACTLWTDFNNARSGRGPGSFTLCPTTVAKNILRCECRGVRVRRERAILHARMIILFV